MELCCFHKLLSLLIILYCTSNAVIQISVYALVSICATVCLQFKSFERCWWVISVKGKTKHTANRCSQPRLVCQSLRLLKAFMQSRFWAVNNNRGLNHFIWTERGQRLFIWSRDGIHECIQQTSIFLHKQFQIWWVQKEKYLSQSHAYFCFKSLVLW